MAIIVCPECGGKVSTKASCCPHCGAPVEAKVASDPSPAIVARQPPAAPHPTHDALSLLEEDAETTPHSGTPTHAPETVIVPLIDAAHQIIQPVSIQTLADESEVSITGMPLRRHKWTPEVKLPPRSDTRHPSTHVAPPKPLKRKRKFGLPDNRLSRLLKKADAINEEVILAGMVQRHLTSAGILGFLPIFANFALHYLIFMKDRLIVAQGDVTPRPEEFQVFPYESINEIVYRSSSWFPSKLTIRFKNGEKIIYGRAKRHFIETIGLQMPLYLAVRSE